jgi:hypothetical protein
MLGLDRDTGYDLGNMTYPSSAVAEVLGKGLKAGRPLKIGHNLLEAIKEFIALAIDGSTDHPEDPIKAGRAWVTAEDLLAISWRGFRSGRGQTVKILEEFKSFLSRYESLKRWTEKNKVVAKHLRQFCLAMHSQGDQDCSAERHKSGCF